MPPWKLVFEYELTLAAQARSRGNEGQARVCARRAAGIVLRQYYGLVETASAYDLLQKLLADDSAPSAARQAAQALTLRVNSQFALPEEIDLLEQAQILAGALLG